ncbi:hypothetical protein SFC07_11035 [Corynebacterium callunae]|uniref:hypothetical protein n=1 Tax=Corynebacterium callunae TaxID=1721 RepID=UPI0039826BCC
MVAVDFYDLKDKNDELLIAPLNFAVLVGKFGEVTIPDRLTDDTGILQALPEGFKTVGEIQKAAGITLTPELTLTGPEGYGSRGRRRDLIQTEGFGIDYTAQEQRLINLETGMDLDVETPELSPSEIRFSKRRNRKMPEYSVILIGLDAENAIGKDIYPYWIYSRMVQTARNPLNLTDSNIMEYAVRLDMKELESTSTLMPFYFGLAGPGVPDYASAVGLTLPPAGN